MSLTTDLKKTATGTGEVLVGIVDVAVGKVREARGQVAATRNALTHIDPKGLQKELVKQVQEVPSLAVGTAKGLIGKVQADVTSTVSTLESRGDTLITRLRTQRATKDLVKQVDTTIAVGKGAVTTARHAVDTTASTAKATFTTARKESAKATETVKETAAKVEDDVKTDIAEAKPEVKAAAKRTATSAKRTRTTAKKAATRTTSRAKATATTAKKTVAAATKAVEEGAAKVGDDTQAAAAEQAETSATA